MGGVRRILVAILGLTAIACGAGSAGNPRTVLLITVDTLRADHVSAFGYSLPTTPCLDAVALRGARFSRCISQHPETGPSITSMHTSRYPRETGVRENGDLLDAEVPTLAERFQEAGYATGGFVSTYLLKPRACGLDRGFDQYDHEMTSPNFGHEDFERPASETVDRALAWFEEHEGRNRFLFVHLYDPHGPYDPGDAIADRFRRDSGRPPLAPEQIVRYQRHDGSLDPDDYFARYDGEIFRADREVGRLLQALPEDAIVAFTADHGEGLGESDYWFRHGSLLDEASLHVPLLFFGPGVREALTVNEPVANLDVAPTLLDLAGLAPLPGARGRSLRCWMRSRDPETVPVYSEARRRETVSDRTGIDTRYKVSVTTSRHRALLWPETGETMLVEPRDDPDQAADLTGKYPLVAERWTAALRRFLLIGDRLSADDPPPDVDDALRGLGYFRKGGERR